jgi:hypothetical protein
MTLIRPGVTSGTLAANGLDRPTSAVLLSTYGFKWPGFILPYFDRHGVAVMDGGKPFVRLRLDTPLKSICKKTGKAQEMKYYQHKGSQLHLYFPKGFDANYKDSLVLVEGELKALSLVEAGIPAVALIGFYGFQARGTLLPELTDLLLNLKPTRLFFLGDSDTSHNWQFSDAAIKMAKLVSPIEVLLPRIPISMPKGIDDVRDEIGSRFLDFWKEIVADAACVLATTSIKRLCLVLLEREISGFIKMNILERKKLEARIEAIGAYRRAELRDRYNGLIARAGFSLRPI